MYFYTPDGKEVLDGIAGLWCVNAGHCRDEIVRAVQDQVAHMEYSTAFQMSHPGVFEAASRVAKIAPEGMNRVFFTNSGSESVDTALKMAIAYHRSRGESTRTRLIGREKGYHGVGFGGISVGGIPGNRKAYSPVMIPGVDHMRHTYDLARNAYSVGQPAHGAELAEDLERLVVLHDAGNIAAVIVEPLAGSAGVIPPPLGYLQRLREICDKHGILLIFDEVISGFGRLGTPFAAQRFGVTPDLMCVAKAINNATIPMGAVIAKQGVYDTITNAGAENQIEFLHGYTYSGHPVACAAANATLALYEKEDLFGRAAAMEPKFAAAVHSLKGTRHVIDIRNLGLVGGIELESRPGKPGARAYEVMLHCLEAGVLVRVTGDIIALSPPLIVEEAQLARIIETIGAALRAVD